MYSFLWHGHIYCKEKTETESISQKKFLCGKSIVIIINKSSNYHDFLPEDRVNSV